MSFFYYKETGVGRYKGEQERRKLFDGPRTFDAWLLHVASEHMESADTADETPMPQMRTELLCLLSCGGTEVARVAGGRRERCPSDGEESPTRKIALTSVEHWHGRDFAVTESSG